MKCLLSLLLIFISFSAHADEFAVYESEHSQKIENILSTFWGEDVKLRVKLSVTRKPEIQKEEVTTVEAQSGSALQEIGYIPFPIDVEKVQNQSNTQLNKQIIKKEIPKIEEKILSLSAFVYHDDKLNSDMRSQVEKIVAQYFKNIPTTISFLKVEIPFKPEEIQEEKPSWGQRVLDKHLGTIVIMIGILVISLILIPIIVIAVIKSLDKFSQTLGTGLGVVANSFTQKSEAEMKMQIQEDRMREEAKEEGRWNAAQFDNYLYILLKQFDTDPGLFYEKIKNKSDYIAFKRLLPFISEKFPEKLSQATPGEILIRINEVSDEQTQEMSRAELVTWMGKLTQQLSISNISNNGILIRLLDEELFLKLKEVPVDKLSDLMGQSYDTCELRLLFELVPSAEVESFFKRASEEKLEMALEEVDFEKDKVNIAAKNILRKSNTTLEDETVISYKDSITDIINYVDSYLKSLPFQDDEFYLQKLAEISPEFIEPLRRKNWTFKNLEKVPIELLMKKFEVKEPSQKIDLLLALPEGIRALILNELPPRNSKTILVDSLNKAISRSDGTQLDRAKIAAKAFVESIRLELYKTDQYEDFLILDEIAPTIAATA